MLKHFVTKISSMKKLLFKTNINKLLVYVWSNHFWSGYTVRKVSNKKVSFLLIIYKTMMLGVMIAIVIVDQRKLLPSLTVHSQFVRNEKNKLAKSRLNRVTNLFFVLLHKKDPHSIVTVSSHEYGRAFA